MKPALRITLVITLFFCIYCNIFVFFIAPLLDHLLVQYFHNTIHSAIKAICLILISTLPAFFICHKLIKAYLIEQKKTEEIRASWAAVIKSEENYKTLINRISEGFVSLDRDLVYTYVNDRILKRVGKTKDEVLGKYIGEVFPEFMQTKTFYEMQKALREQKPVTFEDYYMPSDSWQENYIYPSADGLSVFVTDITESKRTELALKKRKNVSEL